MNMKRESQKLLEQSGGGGGVGWGVNQSYEDSGLYLEGHLLKIKSHYRSERPRRGSCGVLWYFVTLSAHFVCL